MECSCGSDQEIDLLYSCSGAANTGFLADQVMRTLMRKKVGEGTCLAAVGADLSGFIVSAQNAGRNIVLDGCKVSCGKKIFEKNSLFYEHYVMIDFDVQKGKSVITGDVIEEVSGRITENLNEAAK